MASNRDQTVSMAVCLHKIASSSCCLPRPILRGQDLALTSTWGPSNCVAAAATASVIARVNQVIPVQTIDQ